MNVLLLLLFILTKNQKWFQWDTLMAWYWGTSDIAIWYNMYCLQVDRCCVTFGETIHRVLTLHIGDPGFTWCWRKRIWIYVINPNLKETKNLSKPNLWNPNPKKQKNLSAKTNPWENGKPATNEHVEIKGQNVLSANY